MRRRAALAVASTIGFVAWVSPAAAVTVPSDVEIRGFGFDLTNGVMQGRVESPRDACLRNRIVRMSTVTDGEPLPLDRDRSSDNGYWGGEGPVVPGDEIRFRVRMKPKRLGPHRRCAGDADVRIPGPGRLAARVTYPTSLFLGGASLGVSVHVEGRVVAREACRRNRRVRITALTPAGDFFMGTDRASDNGYFGGGGTPPEAANGLTVVAPTKRLGPGRRCAQAAAGVAK
jgi:hypothetical protein